MLGLMKLSNNDGDMALQERGRPKPGRGNVLVEVRATGICGTDIHILKGEYKVVPPVIIGHEVCGLVCEVGEDVPNDIIGRRVVTETFFSTCGACRYCREGQPNMCASRKSIGTHVDGAMTAFVQVPATALYPVPDWLSDSAASMAEPVACVMNSVVSEQPRISPDIEVLVTGPGAIGLIAAQVARASGGRVHIRGTRNDRNRLDLAEKLGFEVSDTDTPLHEGRFDAAIECSGSSFGVADAMRALCKRGQLMQMGIIGRDATLPFDLVCYKELSITSGFASTPRAWRRAMALIQEKKVDLECLVSNVAPLKDWAGLFKQSMSAQGVKFVFDPRM